MREKRHGKWETWSQTAFTAMEIDQRIMKADFVTTIAK